MTSQLYWACGRAPRGREHSGHEEARPQPPDHDQYGHHVRRQGPGQHPHQQENCHNNHRPSSLCIHCLSLYFEVT